MTDVTIKTALLSVSDKSQLKELATSLREHKVQMIATGGTYKQLIDLGFQVTSVESVNKNPEAFDGRVKTLGFYISGGILFDRTNPEHVAEAKRLEVPAIDMVVCNLYPFEETAKKRNVSETDLIENIDIGGVTLIRAAAKNHKSVAIVTDPNRYSKIIQELNKNSGKLSLKLRQELAVDGLRHTAYYDQAIAMTLSQRLLDESTQLISPGLGEELRYGENPHQSARVIKTGHGVASAKVLQGKEMSYNNYVDADAALNAVYELKRQAEFCHAHSVSIVKHANPCGLSVHKDQTKALELAWAGDPVSSFGSIICFSHEVGLESAQWLSDKFVEVIMAPSFSKEAQDIFAKKKNLRLLGLDFDLLGKERKQVKSISGGLLVQDLDQHIDCEFQGVTDKSFTDQDLKLATFGVSACKYLKSNAIAFVRFHDDAYQLIGAGMGNPNRLVSTEQAAQKARENKITDFCQVMAISDAFFPFKDNIEKLNDYGVKKVVQPGGSMRDDEVIAACNEFGIAMVTTGKRHFNH